MENTYLGKHMKGVYQSHISFNDKYHISTAFRMKNYAKMDKQNCFLKFCKMKLLKS